MENYKKTNQIVAQIWRAVLCAFVCLLIIVPIKTTGQGRGISALMNILFPKMEVQAANTPYVAKDLSGMAYSVFSESKSTLYITRSDNTSLQVNDKFPEFTDDQGNTITDGIVAQRDLEVNNHQISNGGNEPGWIVNKSKDIADKIVTINFLEDIKPVNTSLWFRNFSALTQIKNIKNHLDTSNVTNMNNMFLGCSGITSLDVSRFDTSNVTDMSYMFDGCSKLTFLNVSNFDTSNVTWMQGMFYRCSGLTSLNVSGFDTSNVENISSMFYYCKSLTSLDVSNFNTSKVTSMGAMFGDCSSLTSIDVSRFDTSKVTGMNFMFDGCSKLTKLDVSGFDTNKVTNMNMMFNGCSKLTKLDVSGFDTNKVTNMDMMFDRCSSLTSLDVSRFNTSKVTGMNAMFMHCSKLTSLNVSGFDTSNVTDMSYMFNDCPNLTSITFGSKTKLKNGCSLPTQNDRSKFTGKWVLNDPYNHTKQCSTDELIAKTQSTGGAPGLWVAERTGTDPKTQGYTSISANIYDSASHMNADGSIKTGEDPVSLYRTNDGGSGYWQKLADGRWAYTFFVFKNDETDWQVWEDGVSGYTGDYTIKTPLSISGTDIQKGDQPVITNTKNNAPKYGSLKLTKKVVKADGSVASTAQEFTFNITLTGNNISSSQIFGDTPFSSGFATVHLGNGESISFTDIPAGTIYKIEETPVSGFTGSLDHPSGTITANGTVSVLCTNTKQEEQKDYVSLSVKKTVTSNADESDTEFPFHAAFTNLEANAAYQTSNGTSFAADGNGNANADFTLKQNQTITFQNIPVGSKYTITEDGGDYLSSYKITDSAGVNKIVSSSGKSVQTDTGLSTSRETADKGESVQVTFTNEMTRTQDLVLTKSSVKADGTANTSDTDQYVVDVYFSGLTGKQRIKTSNGILTADDDGIIETGMYISPGQKITFFNVPVGVKYRFTEEANSKIPSYSMTNTSEKIDLTGYKAVSEITGDTAKRLDGTQGSGTVMQHMVKHAHTANIGDDGTLSGNYNNNVNYSSATTATADGKTVSENLQTVTIPGADSINVDVTYQTESTLWDWLYIYKGAVTRSSAADSGTAGTLAKSGKIGGKTKTTLDTITVPGDTVTFVWRTDRSGNGYYGYYATVSGTAKQQTTVNMAKTDSGVRITKNESSTDYMFMKATPEIRDSKAQIRLDFYDDPEGTPADTVYLDTGITEAQYNTMDAAERDDTVLKSLSTKSTASIASASGENTEANTSLSTAEETVDAGENITVAFTNTAPKAAKLKVTKYDNTANKHKLGGAELALYKADGTPVNFTADETNIITIGTNGESEVLESPLFIEGSYYLVETKAPDGYTVNGEPKAFQITAADTGKTLQIEVYDDKLIIFPITGGEGNRYMLSIACILAASAVAMIIYKKRQRAIA